VQTTHVTTNRWMNKQMWYIHAMEYYLVQKKKKRNEELHQYMLTEGWTQKH
jgi:hypothetical protein